MDNNHDRLIRQRAYELWEAEGRPAGRESAHWEQAEREVSEASAASSSTNGGPRVANPQEPGPALSTERTPPRKKRETMKPARARSAR